MLVELVAVVLEAVAWSVMATVTPVASTATPPSAAAIFANGRRLGPGRLLSGGVRAPPV